MHISVGQIMNLIAICIVPKSNSVSPPLFEKMEVYQKLLGGDTEIFVRQKLFIKINK